MSSGIEKSRPYQASRAALGTARRAVGGREKPRRCNRRENCITVRASGKGEPRVRVRGSLILCGRGRRAPGGNLDVFDLPAVPQWPYQRAGDGDMNEPPVFINDEFVSGGGEEQREQRGQIG